jgi:tetratricopeptide (TPR) repeat protein
MQTAANNILFFTGCSSFKQLADLSKTTNPGAFYQQIALEIIKGCGSRQLLSEFAERLIAVADRAYFLRRKEVVRQASLLLMNMDRRYESIALFYQAMSFKREGGLEQAHTLMGRVADTAAPGYRERALLSLGTFYYETGDYQSASHLYAESGRARAKNRRPDLITVTQTQWMVAVLKSVDGDHAGALSDLIKLKPLVLTISTRYPHFYYDYLNSLAVELGEIGRLDEALSASRVAASSPYAAAYPELRETLDELTQKSRRHSRSTITVSPPAPPAENVVNLPAVQRTLYGGFKKYEASVPHRARVFKFKDYINLIKEARRAAEDKAGLKAAVELKEARLEGLRRLTTRQKLLRIIDLMSDDTITDNKLLKILLVLEKVEEGRDTN